MYGILLIRCVCCKIEPVMCTPCTTLNNVRMCNGKHTMFQCDQYVPLPYMKLYHVSIKLMCIQ